MSFVDTTPFDLRSSKYNIEQSSLKTTKYDIEKNSYIYHNTTRNPRLLLLKDVTMKINDLNNSCLSIHLFNSTDISVIDNLEKLEEQFFQEPDESIKPLVRESENFPDLRFVSVVLKPESIIYSKMGDELKPISKDQFEKLVSDKRFNGNLLIKIHGYNESKRTGIKSMKLHVYNLLVSNLVESETHTNKNEWLLG